MNKSYSKKKIVLEGYLDYCEDWGMAVYAVFPKRITSKDMDELIEEHNRDWKMGLKNMRNYCHIFWGLMEKFKATNIGELLAKFKGRKVRLTLEVELPKNARKEKEGGG